MKPKRCRHCKQAFIPARPLQSVCDWACGHALIVANKLKADQRAEREQRKDTKAKLDKLKTKSQWANEAQAAFNAFIRERDKGQPCISSGRFTGKMNAGHYLSRGAHPELRFHEDNCHLQSEKDNSYLSGNQVDYRKGLIAKIGLERVEWLEGPHEPKKYTIDDLKAIKAEYKAKLKALSSS